ncbi:hypothetical protein [Bacteroides graminisolvens]|uniref:hypothetical protein n=1 Tax=Bacteroides graminisolvens TaxID=477666 RepID=UPI00240A3613|nr:hypothetical protein [Bacteroides graminisolvens]
MAIEFAKLIGGFIHWLIHGCKTSLQDEVEGNLDATWGGSYNTENYIIGVVTVIIILGIVLPLVF